MAAPADNLPRNVRRVEGPRGVRYQARVAVPPALRAAQGKPRLAATFDTVREAQQWLLDVQACFAASEPWIPSRPRAVAPSLLSDALADWLLARGRSKARETVRNDAQTVELLLDHLWERDPKRAWAVADLSRELAAGFYDWLRRPEAARHKRTRSERTCQKHVSVLMVAWHWLEAHETHGLYARRPRAPELPKLRPAYRPAPTWAEWDRMLAALDQSLQRYPSDWTWRLALLARGTVRRHSALLHLDWQDVDLDANRVHWRAEHDKAARDWWTPLPSWLREDMAGWGVREGRVVGAPEAEITGRGHVGRTIGRAWKRAGIPADRWKGRPLHVARHTIESEMAATWGQPVLDWYVGHVSPGTGPLVYRDRIMHADRLWPQLVELADAVPAPVLGKVERLRAVEG